MRTITTSDFMRIFRLDQYGPEVQEAIYKIINLGPATHETNGLLTAEDKAKLDALGIQYDTTANWALRTDYVPAAGIIIIYSDHATVGGSVIPGVKVGDGMTLVGSLAFVGDDVLALAASKYTKPAGGIPKADLDSGVQGSLDSADASVTAIAGIRALIPTQASDQNQLADKNFVNSSISTATATHRGSYNLVTDLSLTTSATEAQIVAALASAISVADNNDYAFVQVPTSDATPSQIKQVDRYKFNGTAWSFEYTLNNSGFTAEQWAALNSSITSGLVSKLSALPTNSELQTLLNGKASTSDLTAHTGNGDIHVTAQQKEAWTAKQDAIGDLAQIRSDAAAGASAAAALGGKTAAEILDEAAGQQPKTESMVEQAFIFRKSPATIKAKAFSLDRILGRTLVWNQLVQNGDFADGATGWSGNPSVSDGVATLVKTATGTATTGSISKLNMPYENGHTYLFVCLAKSNNATTYFNIVPTGTASDGGSGRAILPTWTLVSYLWTRSGTATSLALRGDNTGNPDADIDFSVKNVMCFDLTQMWGAGDEPTAGVSRALYNKVYFPATPGQLISNDAAALETVGFNQWDEVYEVGSISSTTGGNSVSSTFSRSKNFIPVISGKTYFVKGKMYPRYYDANKNYIGYTMSVTNNEFTPIAGAAFMRFVFEGTTYANNICINLSDPAKNGTYEPHWSKYLPLNLSTRTGKLNGQGASVVVFPDGLKSAGTGANMVQDGTDGTTATKRVGTRAYQTGDENDSTLTTDGTNTNYPLTAAETYVLDEPLVLTTKAGTTEERISPNADGLSAPMLCDMTYEVVPDATDDVLTLLQRIDALMARVAELESNA